jgi:hypothetical protein
MVFGSSVAFTNAGVFGKLALTAYFRLNIDAEILRLGVGSRPYLDDDAIAISLGKRSSGNEGVSGFLKIESGFARRASAISFTTCSLGATLPPFGPGVAFWSGSFAEKAEVPVATIVRMARMSRRMFMIVVFKSEALLS